MTDPLPTWGDWGADVRDDPYAHVNGAREACPVQHVRLGDGPDAWLVLGYDAARRSLKDPRLSKDMLAAMDADPHVVDEGLPGPAFARHMLAVDPPDHTRLRSLVARAFAPSRIAALEPRLEKIAQELLDGLERSGPVVDLVAGFALPFPFRVIGELLGVPEADQPSLHQAFRTLLQPWRGSPPPAAVDASAEIVAYLEHLVDARTEAPTDDLVSVLVTAEGEEGRLTRQELLSSLFQLVVAGHDTTTSLIGNGVVALFDHPDQRRLLHDQPALLPGAIEELIRFAPPVPHATFRVTTEPVELDGVTIPAHQQVLVCIAGANRDPAAHDDPDTLDVRRAPRQHLGFGHGIHFCLGAPLARLEGRIAFRALLDRFPSMELAVPRHALAWSHGDGLVLRGLAELPVRLAPGTLPRG